MGGYYVPNIQRPGFGYQRRSEDDEDEFGDASDWGGGGAATPASDATDASSATGGYSPLAVNSPARGMRSMSATTPAVQNPEYWPSGMDWGASSLQGNSPYATSGLSDSYGTPSRGGAGTAPTNTEMNLAEPPEPPVPQDAEIPTGTNVPGIGQPPMGRPSRVPPPVSSHAEQEKLKEMIKKGPKRSILGTIAAGAAGFGVGYVNAAGRTRNPIPVPTQAMRNLTWRAPGGGAWDTKLARQKELAEQEQGEEKRALTAEQVRAQAEERQAQADYYKQHGDYLGQEAKTHAKAEEDRQKQQQLQRITQMGGRTPQIRSFPAGQPPPEVAKSSDWYVKADPYDPRSMIAVRPNPGDQIDDETAEFLGIPKGSYVQPKDAVGAARAKVAAANTAQTSTNRENEELRRRLADEERARHNKQMEGLSAGSAEDRAEANRQRQEAAQQKMSDAIDAARERELTSAKVWANNARNKKVAVGGIVTAAEEAEIAREELRQSQAAYDRWSQAIRRRPGQTAADFTVHPDGSVEQATESYGAGGKGVPLAGGGPTPTPKTPATPATPTGGGRGGRGNVPPPVQTAPQAKTMTTADLQDYATDHTNGDLAAARKIFTNKGWTITP